ncbi:MAG: ribonuclease E/G [Proteobacteria bacterium]|nr:ribonuclease E/G [Pseudomonadota bacterium]
MAGCSLFINVIPGETRIALTDAEGQLMQLAIDRDGGGQKRPATENIYLGRVLQVVPGLNAAFVDIGDTTPGFLNANDALPLRLQGTNRISATKISDCVHEGEAVAVQVLTPPTGEKGARVSRRIRLRGRSVDYLPAEPDDPAASGEAAHLRERWSEIQPRLDQATAPSLIAAGAGALEAIIRDHADKGWDRIVIDNRRSLPVVKGYLSRYCPDLIDRLDHDEAGGALFEREELEEQIDMALQPHCPLPGGGSIIIEPTAALTAIDVNAGPGAANNNPEVLATAVNLDATRELARQLRLRDLGGQIVIDYLPMRKKANRKKVLDALRSGQADDSAEAYVAGFTQLGLVEMTRHRQGISLAEVLAAPGGGGKSALTIAYDIIRALIKESFHSNPNGKVTASPAVINVLKNDVAGSLQEVQLKVGAVSLEADPMLNNDAFRIGPTA